MKKVYFAVLCALCAVSTFAQPSTPRTQAEGVATEQPEGRLVDKMVRTGAAYSSYSGAVAQTDILVGRIVVNEEEGLVWVYNLAQSGGYDVWSKGVLGDDGVVSFAPAEFEYDGSTVRLQAATYNMSNNTCTVSGDGTFKMQLSGDSLLCTTSDAIAAFVDGEWKEVADMDFQIVPNPYKAVLRADVDAEFETFQASYTDLYSNELSQTVDVALTADKIYINGLNGMNADACIVGTIAGEQVVFENLQYMDIDPEYGMHTFLHTDSIYREYSTYYERYQTTADIMDRIVDAWDPATRTLTMDYGHCFSADGKTEEIYTMGIYRGLTLKPYAAAPAAPADPVIDLDQSFDYDEGRGYGLLLLTLPDTTVNGDFIDHDSLYYCFYLNDATAPSELSAFGTYDVEAGTTEILYDAEESEYNFFRHAMYGNHYFYYTLEEYDSIGVQLVYHTGNGETYRSNIVYRVSELLAGVEQITGDGAQVTAVFGLDGKRRAHQERGVNIVRYSDGTTRKVIR